MAAARQFCEIQKTKLQPAPAPARFTFTAKPDTDFKTHNINNVLDFKYIYFDGEMTEIIITETNQYAKRGLLFCTHNLNVILLKMK